MSVDTFYGGLDGSTSSQIGDYIHFRYSNYRIWGTFRRPSGITKGVGSNGNLPALSPISIAERHQEAMRLYLQNKKQRLQGVSAEAERRANFYLNSSTNPQDSNNMNIVREGIQQYLNVNGNLLNWQNITADRLAGNVNKLLLGQDINSLGVSEDLLRWFAKERNFQEQSRFNVGRMRRTLNGLFFLREEINRSIQNGGGQWDVFLQQLNQLEEMARNFERVVSEEESRRKENSRNPVLGNRMFLNSSNNRNLIDWVNNLLNMLTSYTASQVGGKFLELLAMAGEYMATTTATKSVQDLLRFFEINDPANNLSIKLNRKEYFAMGNLPTDTGNLFQFQNQTEDKVDVTYNINNQEVGLSLKNYNMSALGRQQHPDITLLRGRNLLGLVQTETVFVNHFLNVVVNHPASGDDQPTGEEIAAFHRAMKMTIFLKAIAGGVWTNLGLSREVDFFVVHDNSRPGSQMRFYHLEDIFNKVANNIEDYLRIAHYPESSWKVNNWQSQRGKTRQEAVKDRILAILLEMRNINLYVTISKNVFDENLDL